MSQTAQNFITAILIGVILFLIALNNNKFKQQKKDYIKLNHDLQTRLDSTDRELGRTTYQRDSMAVLVDSLHLYRKMDSANIVKLNIELKSIKGRFNNLTDNELQQKMIEEWQKSVN